MSNARLAMSQPEFRYVCLHLRVEKLSELSRKQLERAGICGISEAEPFVAYGIIDTLHPFSFQTKAHPEVKTIEFGEPPNAK